tara:strand:- start:206 stop:1423 length:1218 start_codon:yes stop_codon:yes gene_type:complete
LLFQTLDDKGECVGIYYDGELLFNLEDFPQNLTRTWSYSSYMEGYRGVDYANIYALGKSLTEMCPEHLRDEWDSLQKQRSALIRSLAISKISLQQNCLFDLLPGWFLKEYCEMKNKITDHIIEKYPKPPNYKHLFAVSKMLTEIRDQKLNVDISPLKRKPQTPEIKNLIKKISNCSPYISYNQFGTITGRLTTRPATFPILTLKKEHRTVIRPTNDFFLELDFNGAELRVLLGLLGFEQPGGDVHEWNVQNVFSNEMSRSEAKEAFFAWLYGSHSPKLKKYQERLSKHYDRTTLLNKHWDGDFVRTPYGKDIKSDERRALNYLIQSTAAAVALEQAVKIRNALKGRRSKISFIVHDAVVIDFCSEDKELFNKIGSLMSDTRFGKFLVTAKIGKNFADMKEAKAFV